MATRCTARPVLAIALGAWLFATAAPAGATGTALVQEITAEGTQTVLSTGAAAAAQPDEVRSDYLWRSTHVGWIGSSTGISLLSGRDDVVVGHGNAPPTMVEFFEAEGAGTPYHTVTATQAEVAARDGVYASADVTAAGITLSVWYLDPTQAPWTLAMPGASPAGVSNTLQVSFEGSRVLFGCFFAGQVRFVAIDAATGDKLVDVQLPYTSLRGISCSDDGRYAVLNCGATHVVYDVETDAVRGTINAGASTNPTAISETGEWVAAGFTSCKAWQWDAGTQSYVLRWTRSTSNHYLGVNMISENGCWIVGWYSSSYNKNRFQRWDLVTGQPVWTIDLPVSSGSVQDLPVAIDYSRNRGVIAFGCWGDNAMVSPEIWVIDPDGNELASLQAPGSIFDVAVSTDGRYVSGTGKLVHANIMGSGSDAYCLFAGDPSAVEAPLAMSAVSPITAWPNPAHGSATLRWSGPAQADAWVHIIDGTGRLVRELRVGPQGTAWDGADAAGRALPGGIYYLRPLAAGGEAARLLLLR